MNAPITVSGVGIPCRGEHSTIYHRRGHGTAPGSRPISECARSARSAAPPRPRMRGRDDGGCEWKAQLLPCVILGLVPRTHYAAGETASARKVHPDRKSVV